MTRETCILLILAATFSVCSAQCQTKPTSPKKETGKAIPPNHPLQAQTVSNLVYRSRDIFEVKAIGTLSVPDAGIAIVTLESATDVGRGKVDRVNQSVVLVKGETKQILLSSPGTKDPLLGSCGALLNLDSSGSLALGPLKLPSPPPTLNQPASSAYCTGLPGVVEMRFHALVVSPE
jgi:hypothetical protein